MSVSGLRSFIPTNQIIKWLQNNAVSLTDTQTLTNKTLTAPTITGGTASSKSSVTEYSASGALTISHGCHVVTKTSAAAMTLAAPTTAQNGTIVTVMSSTAYAHTITCPSAIIVNGTSAYTVGTCAAVIGCTIRLIAYGGKWYQSGISGVTLS